MNDFDFNLLVVFDLLLVSIEVIMVLQVWYLCLEQVLVIVGCGSGCVRCVVSKKKFV